MHLSGSSPAYPITPDFFKKEVDMSMKSVCTFMLFILLVFVVLALISVHVGCSPFKPLPPLKPLPPIGTEYAVLPQ